MDLGDEKNSERCSFHVNRQYSNNLHKGKQPHGDGQEACSYRIYKEQGPKKYLELKALIE